MLEKANNRTKEGKAEEVPRGPYWLLVEERDSGRGMYAAIDEAGGGARKNFRREIGDDVFLVERGTYKVLPIFASEEAADLFLASLKDSGAGSGYRKRKTWAAELLSVLCASAYSSGPCAGVEKVALDPLSREEALREEAKGSGGRPRCMDRQCFQEHLMGRGAGWFRDMGGRSYER